MTGQPLKKLWIGLPLLEKEVCLSIRTDTLWKMSTIAILSGELNGWHPFVAFILSVSVCVKEIQKCIGNKYIDELSAQVEQIQYYRVFWV